MILMIFFCVNFISMHVSFNCFSFHFSKRPLVIFNYEIRELVVFSDFIIAKIHPFRQYLCLYSNIVCSTYYKYLFRPVV